MKKAATIALAALTAALMLTACGSNTGSGGTANGGSSSVTESGGSVNGVTGGGTGSGTDNAQAGTSDGILSDAADEAGDAISRMTGSARKVRGASFDEMMRNGTVHDSNGFLNDGENAVTPGTR